MNTSKPHTVSDTYVLTHHIKSSVANVYFYNINLVIVEVKEGKELTILTGTSLMFKAMLYLKNKPWVYLSNRVNEYSVDPTEYDYLDSIPTLKALSIVRLPSAINKTPPVEAFFCKKPFQLFHNLEEAMIWGARLLEKNN